MAISPNMKEYKLGMQKKGTSLANPQHPVPSTANPISKNKPPLGGIPTSHPFKPGRGTI